MIKIVKPWFVVLIVSISLIAVTTFFGGKRKDNEQDFVKLPAEAVVKKVEEGDWGGDGKVTFTLPNTHPVSTWLDIVWKMNPPEGDIVTGKTDEFVSGPYERRSSYGGASNRLTCQGVAEGATHLYEYDLLLER